MNLWLNTHMLLLLSLSRDVTGKVYVYFFINHFSFTVSFVIIVKCYR